MDFPEHLKLLQQLESLWGDGSEREGGEWERERDRQRERGSGERQLSMHSGASKPEINTTFCSLAGGRVHISRCVCVSASLVEVGGDGVGGGGNRRRGKRKGRGRAR